MAFVAVTLHCMRSIWKENDDSRGHKTLGTPYLLQSPIQPGAAKLGKNSFWSSMFYFDMPRDLFENLEIYQRLKIWKISRENEGCLKKCLVQKYLFFIMSDWSKFQNTAFLLVDTQIWINFLRADLTKKESSNEWSNFFKK